jgi:DNA invertase Pin-like site-specific DNA recombinase
MRKSLRLLGYVRVSSREQKENGLSLLTQAEKVRMWCVLHGHELVEVVADEGKSAKSLNRPGVQRCLAALRAGEVDGVIVAHLDRLTRSLKDLQLLLEEFFGEGRSQLVSVSDSLDTTTAAGRLVINILMSVAQWQREYIVERTVEVIDEKRANNERTGEIPYGKRLDLDGPKNARGRPMRLIVDEREAAVLEVIQELDAKGRTLREICAALNDELHIPTRRGRPWKRSTISDILARLKRAADAEHGS